jgi:hypothetical protein
MPFSFFPVCFSTCFCVPGDKGECFFFDIVVFPLRLLFLYELLYTNSYTSSLSPNRIFGVISFYDPVLKQSLRQYRGSCTFTELLILKNISVIFRPVRHSPHHPPSGPPAFLHSFIIHFASYQFVTTSSPLKQPWPRGKATNAPHQHPPCLLRRASSRGRITFDASLSGNSNRDNCRQAPTTPLWLRLVLPQGIEDPPAPPPPLMPPLPLRSPPSLPQLHRPLPLPPPPRSQGPLPPLMHKRRVQSHPHVSAKGFVNVRVLPLFKGGGVAL